jgi:hypothetical protein
MDRLNRHDDVERASDRRLGRESQEEGGRHRPYDLADRPIIVLSS